MRNDEDGFWGFVIGVVAATFIILVILAAFDDRPSEEDYRKLQIENSTLKRQVYEQSSIITTQSHIITRIAR